MMPEMNIISFSCVSCRKRKLKCDRNIPRCEACSRLKRDCSYPQYRKKTTAPRRQGTKILEERIALIESKLELKSLSSAAGLSIGVTWHENEIFERWHEDASVPMAADREPSESVGVATPERIAVRTQAQAEHNVQDNQDSKGRYSHSMQESPPSEEVQSRLFKIYFDKIYPGIPIIHKSRFYASMDRRRIFGGPLCLQYAMWALAALKTHEDRDLCEMFYLRARKYAEIDEMKVRSRWLTIYHAQCWHLIARFEVEGMYFTRAWMSAGRCVRLVQMMGLYRIDEGDLSVPRVLPQTYDFIELEERRRTFWAAYFGDRMASMGNGWPMLINESEVCTNLPCSEAAFDDGTEEAGLSLTDALASDTVSRVSSPFSGVLVALTLLGRNFTHIHGNNRTNTKDNFGENFWRRHQDMDDTLTNTLKRLPEPLRMPYAFGDENCVLLNMMLHASTICLHHSAIKIMSRDYFDASFMINSRVKCVAAAHSITMILRLICHQDLSKACMHSCMGFCLYLAGVVCLHDLNSNNPPAPHSSSDLEFLLVAMGAIGKHHTIMELFMRQLALEVKSFKPNGVPDKQRSKNHSTSSVGACIPATTMPTSDTSVAEYISKMSNDETVSTEKESLPQPLLSGIFLHDDKGCPLNSLE